jgi:YgiT-type zinc finger domain-containing protein
MKCAICKHGQTQLGHATVALTRGSTTIVLREVPAEVCANCGEYYLSAEVTAVVLERAERAVQQGAEVEIVRYAA